MSDVIYTAADGKQYKAESVDTNTCGACTFRNDQENCAKSVDTKPCSEYPFHIWQPITIQKPQDTFHKWLEENAEMFRPIFERMKEKE